MRGAQQPRNSVGGAHAGGLRALLGARRGFALAVLPWLLIGLAWPVAAAAPPGWHPDRPPTPDELPLAVAMQWAQAALATCKSLGYPVTATYMNSHLEIKLVLRADGARGGTAETGRRKAYTAVVTGMSSADYGASLGYPPGKPIPRLAGKPIGLPAGVTDQNLIVAGGGLPLRNAAHQVVGAVSVSGALRGKDALCAQAGLDRIAAYLDSHGLR